MVSLPTNQISIRPLATLKNLIVKPGRRKLRIAAGLFRGLNFELDLKHNTQFFLGLYETETFSAIRSASRRCDWVVDVGAGVGELAIYCLNRTQCQVVHAIEPQTTEIAQFERNLGLNGAGGNGRLTIHQKFAGDGDVLTHLAIDDLQLWRMGRGFLKIDVDGFEADVLDSARETLTQGDLDVLVEVHSEQLEADCTARLMALGYEVRIIKNAWWRMIIPEKRPIPHNRWLVASKPH
jgi:hypothetical protein